MCRRWGPPGDRAGLQRLRRGRHGHAAPGWSVALHLRVHPEEREVDAGVRAAGPPGALRRARRNQRDRATRSDRDRPLQEQRGHPGNHDSIPAMLAIEVAASSRDLPRAEARA